MPCLLFIRSLVNMYSDKHKSLDQQIYRPGTPNSDIRKLCTVHCGSNVNKLSTPTEVERERTRALMWYYSPTKNKLIYQVRANTYDFWLSGQYGKYKYFYSTPWALFLQKWCVAPEFFVLISSHCGTQIWRIRYGGSWRISQKNEPDYFSRFTLIGYKKIEQICLKMESITNWTW